MDAEMPGAWKCDKCGFILQKNVLHAGDGAVSADTSPLNERCPNDGQLMRPFTWREANKAFSDDNQRLRQDLAHYKACTLELGELFAKEKRRMDWIDQHCSFVADAEYLLPPFKVGELRKMADAGIAADSAKFEKGPDGLTYT